jgi:hypothetical protein
MFDTGRLSSSCGDMLWVENGGVALCDFGIPLPAHIVGMHHIDDALQTDV